MKRPTYILIFLFGLNSFCGYSEISEPTPPAPAVQPPPPGLPIDNIAIIALFLLLGTYLIFKYKKKTA